MSKRCSAQNKNGKPCGAWAVTGTTECACTPIPGERAQLGARHRSGMKALSVSEMPVLPHRSLKSAGEVCEMLEETINSVRQGVLDIRTANTIGFLSGLQLKALSQKAESAETTDRGQSASVYRSIFNRPGFTPPDQKVYELYPQSPERDEGTAPELAASTDARIDNWPTPPDDQDQVITIEVEYPND